MHTHTVSQHAVLIPRDSKEGYAECLNKDGSIQARLKPVLVSVRSTIIVNGLCMKSVTR